MLEHPLKARSRRRTPLLVACGLSLGLTVLAASPASAEPTVTSTTLTATPSVTVGDAVTVDLGLAGTTGVYAYEVTLTFDPELLTYAPGTETGPAGGFDTIETGDGTLTLVHSRLGTSPSLTGDLTAAVGLTAVDDGDATVSAAVTLVDSDGTSTQTSPAPAAVEIAAVAVEPTPGPTPEPTPTPDPTAAPTTPAPSATPEVAPTPGGTGTTPPSGGAGTVPGAASDNPLASTGFGAVTLVLVAAAATAAGVVLRRRSAGAR